MSTSCLRIRPFAWVSKGETKVRFNKKYFILSNAHLFKSLFLVLSPLPFYSPKLSGVASVFCCDKVSGGYFCHWYFNERNNLYWLHFEFRTPSLFFCSSFSSHSIKTKMCVHVCIHVFSFYCVLDRVSCYIYLGQLTQASRDSLVSAFSLATRILRLWMCGTTSSFFGFWGSQLRSFHLCGKDLLSYFPDPKFIFYIEVPCCIPRI